MATRTTKTDSAQQGPAAVAALLATLAHPHQAGIEQLRRMILALAPEVREEVKWNAPSFRLGDGEHFATFRLHPPKHIQLVLHTGAKAIANSRRFTIADPAGLLRWPASDRCVLTLDSTAALAAHEAAVQRILSQWLAQCRAPA